MGVGMPHGLHLEAFGQLLYDAFGHVAYHVGSSMGPKREWRDVDVRLMLPDNEYAAMGLGHPTYSHMNARWVALCMAFSALGKQMTGLPIDFQIQQTSAANAEFDKPRSALLRRFKTPAEVDALLLPAKVIEMKLSDLNPRWAIDTDIVIGGVRRHYDDRQGMAISFDCPHCRTERLAVWFANPIDGGPPTDDATQLWQRTGDTFETLTLSPSIDASAHGHWHGFIRSGSCE